MIPMVELVLKHKKANMRKSDFSMFEALKSAPHLKDKMFEILKQLWMGIWQHTHTVTTTEVSPDLGELAEILDVENVEMIPIRYH